MDRLAPDVIVALDCGSRAEADGIVTQLGESATWYKIGIQTLVSVGPGLARDLIAARKAVFLDLKLHEVPNSVAGATAAAGDLGASMVTVHATAGERVLDAAVRAAEPFPELRVLALTVITSLGDADLPSIGVPSTVAEQADRLARLARNSGCDGVVCSVQEATAVRSLLDDDALVVTPGVGLGDPADTHVRSDHVRVGTPEHARRVGATHVVLGRSLTRASDLRSTLAHARRRFLG